MSLKFPETCSYKHRRLYSRALLIERLEDRCLLAAEPILVEDVNATPTLPNSAPADFVEVNGIVFFTADDGVHGRELWKTDGTSAGTQLVKDVIAGAGGFNSASAQVSRFTRVGDLIYFLVNDDATHPELWRSDGTEAGTILLTSGRFIRNLTAVGDQLFFTTTELTSTFRNAARIHKSDGTVAGTVQVTDLPPDEAFNASSLTNFGGMLYFAGREDANGSGLWRSDGTAEGTVLLRDISLGTAGAVIGLYTAGSTLYFYADDEVHGRELWKSDGTESGTSLVKDINAGPGGISNLSGVKFAQSSIGNIFYFYANDGVHGYELWKSDGAEAGTTLVRDISPGSAPSALNASAVSLLSIDETIYFSANDGVHGSELWKSDGSEAGTTLVRDFWSAGSGSPVWLTNVNGVLYFAADDFVDGQELWRSDGTPAGTLKVKSIWRGNSGSYLKNLTNVAGTLIFSADDGMRGDELWRSDGTAAGTQLYKDIRGDTASSARSSFLVGGMTYSTATFAVGDTVYFTANDGVNGFELWKSTGATGATLIKDIRPGECGSYPAGFANINGELYFRANDGVHGYELWRSDGTTQGTVLVKDIRSATGKYGAVESITEVNGIAYFFANDGTLGSNHERSLWKTDGTPSGTMVVKQTFGNGLWPASDVINIGGTLFFQMRNYGFAGTFLWRSDGTEAGTVVVKEMGAISSPTVCNGLLYFFGYENSLEGGQLWKSDGTAAGTVRLTTGLNHAGELTSVGNALYFAATWPTAGKELWYSDGTVAGTVLAQDIWPGPVSGYPRYLTNAGGVLYFTADGGGTGSEVWRFDGTPAGTGLVRDIRPGTATSFARKFFEVDGVVYFSANDGASGDELWRTDGTEAGTLLVADLRIGATGAAPRDFAAIDGSLFFVANNGIAGDELWSIPAPLTAAAAGRQATASAFEHPAEDLSPRGDEALPRSAGSTRRSMTAISPPIASEAALESQRWRQSDAKLHEASRRRLRATFIEESRLAMSAWARDVAFKRLSGFPVEFAPEGPPVGPTAVGPSPPEQFIAAEVDRAFAELEGALLPRLLVERAKTASKGV